MRSPFCYMHDLYGALASPCRHLSDLGEVQNIIVKSCILCGVNCLLQGPLPSSQKPCSITRRKIESRFFDEVWSLRSTDHILSSGTAAAVWQSWIDGLALRLKVFTTFYTSPCSTRKGPGSSADKCAQKCTSLELLMLLS